MPLCEFVFFLNPKVAAGTLFQVDGKLVLLKRAIEPGYGKWVFPGGFVDRGETVVEAAIRETREEAGVEVQVRELLDVFSYSGSPIVVVVYAADIVSGEPRAADESLSLEAFAPSELPWEELSLGTGVAPRPARASWGGGGAHGTAGSRASAADGARGRRVGDDRRRAGGPGSPCGSRAGAVTAAAMPL